MADLTVSADIDAFMASANDAAARTELGLTALATTTPGTGVATFLATPSSANLAAALTDETGTGVAVFGTSPAFTTSVTTGSTTFALFNTTATTINAFGAATALNIGASAAMVLNFGGFTSAAELRFLEPSGSGTNYSGFKQPAIAASITYSLPSDAPSNGDVLTSQSDGTLSWEPQSGAANAVTAASAAAGAGLLWTSGGADRTAVATDTVTTINATTAVVTNLNPVSNDGAPLGTAALSFSDLFLASGALINFANGNAVITHSSGILTVSTGDLRVTTAGTNAASAVTVGGTQTLTNKTLTSPTLTTPALGTPASGTLTNCTGLPASGIAAGVLGGNITLGESTGQIILDPTLSADGTWSGIMQSGTAGATLAFGDLIYLAAADSRWELADADAVSTSGDVVLGMCVLAAASDGDPTNVLLYGKIRADAAFPALTIGAPAYAGTTAGDIQTAQPSGTDDVIRVVGYGLTADVLLFNPSGFYITHT